MMSNVAMALHSEKSIKIKFFFMGSRGIERNEAIKLLVYAFFEDIETTEENKTVLIKKELDKYFI